MDVQKTGTEYAECAFISGQSGNKSRKSSVGTDRDGLSGKTAAAEAAGVLSIF